MRVTLCSQPVSAVPCCVSAAIGDQPGNLDEREIAALRGDPNLGQQSSTSAPPGGSSSSARETEESGRTVTPSAPANDPDEIKHVVEEETLHNNNA